MASNSNDQVVKRIGLANGSLPPLPFISLPSFGNLTGVRLVFPTLNRITLPSPSSSPSTHSALSSSFFPCSETEVESNNEDVTDVDEMATSEEEESEVETQPSPGKFELSSNVSFENIPLDGVILEPLPNFNDLILLIRDHCSATLLKMVDQPGQEYSKSGFDDLVSAIWKAMQPYVVNFPHKHFVLILGRLVAGNNTFELPGENFLAQFEKKMDSKYRGCRERLDKIKELHVEHCIPFSSRSSYWPYTTKIINEIYGNLWKMGHPSHEQAVKDAVKLHFENLTFTNFSRDQKVRRIFCRNFLKQIDRYDGQWDDMHDDDEQEESNSRVALDKIVVQPKKPRKDEVVINKKVLGGGYQLKGKLKVCKVLKKPRNTV